jgi:NAD(P)H-hydrate epimerase
MELAGLSVAECVFKCYPPSTHPNILIIAGPGNNGGDGLVAARHLFHFGYSPQIVYPKAHPGLVKLCDQCRQLDIPIHASLSSFDNVQLIIDAIFGFSFKGAIRAPFDEIIRQCKSTSIPILSIDIPSGWDVELGNTHDHGLEPQVLISLSYPKKGCLSFRKRHFIGGRFIPPMISKQFQLNLPNYHATEQSVEVSEDFFLKLLSR